MHTGVWQSHRSTRWKNHTRAYPYIKMASEAILILAWLLFRQGKIREKSYPSPWPLTSFFQVHTLLVLFFGPPARSCRHQILKILLLVVALVLLVVRFNWQWYKMYCFWCTLHKNQLKWIWRIVKFSLGRTGLFVLAHIPDFPVTEINR